jgi:type IV pilus assembly protein PilA
VHGGRGQCREPRLDLSRESTGTTHLLKGRPSGRPFGVPLVGTYPSTGIRRAPRSADAGSMTVSKARSEQGFTLVEVLVVVVVLGVLIALGLPMFLGARLRAQDRAAQAELRSGLTAALTYWADGATFTAFDAGCSPTPDDCTVAEGVEVSVMWVGPGAPADRQISIVLASGNGLLLVARSTAGEYLCVAQSTGQTDRGRGATFADVDTLVECAGGW